ncbi:hypothetical protein AMJ74_02115 [candidate division WOR_3 bacterium SM1_77]|jgi:hypothetical protein|uniref:Uncharacterized protein n=1 Tax=candidate division WOR_3 bacterium SM1_77 TaxID=1703778 RepID=A0A0S8K2G9_UNCW3|nr:MAG: hypothetical protein AMJ74_02115 [candidate division WOR_3 bacterium SM1_77]
MKKLAFVITLIIFVFSVVGLYSSISDAIAVQGRFILLRVLLCILGIGTFVAFMFKKRLFALLGTIWFLPQIIVLSERFVDPMYDAYAERTVYDLTLSISSVLVVAIEKTPDVFLRIGVNLVGLTGLILSLVIAAAVFRKSDFFRKKGG